MARGDKNSNWSEEAYLDLFFFVENMSGPWHPTEWQTIVNLLSQIGSWDGVRKQMNPTNKIIRKSDLYMTTNYRMFIVALMEAEYFQDFAEFIQFTKDALSSEYIFNIYKAWFALDCPMNDEHPYFREFEIEVNKRIHSKDTAEIETITVDMSDEYINNELEKMSLEMKLEEE
jgi:hypothetical protein